MRLRCLLATLVLISVLCIPVQAQDEMDIRHEIGISYGAAPNSAWFNSYTDIVPEMFGVAYKNKHFIGPIGVEYHYRINRLIGVGGIFTFSTTNEDGFMDKDKVKVTHAHKAYISVMPSVKLNWLRRANWGLYSKFAAGVTYARGVDHNYGSDGHSADEKTVSKDLLFNYQASLIGIEGGGQHVRGFLEAGIGEQGVAVAGVRYRF